MTEHVTTVLEFREAGILLPSEGVHVVRVLGAAREVPIPPAPPPKEQLAAPASAETYDAYYAGALQGPEEVEAEPMPAHVPVLFVDAEGHPTLIRRDGR